MKEMAHTVGVALGITTVLVGMAVGSVVAVGPPGVWVGGRGVELGSTDVGLPVACGVICGVPIAVVLGMAVGISVAVCSTVFVGVGVESGLVPDIFEMKPSLSPALVGW